MGLWPWRKAKAPKVEAAGQRFDVDLYHVTGNIHQVENVSPELLKFIRNNIGRDEIYAQERVVINLREYSMALIKDNTGAKSK